MNRTLILILLVAVILVIASAIVIANAGLGPQVFGFLKFVPGGDKTAHFVGMGVLSLLANLALNGRKSGRLTMGTQIGTLACLVFVVVEESSQVFIPSRSFGLFDFVANIAGVLIGGRLALKILQSSQRGMASRPKC